MNSDWPGWFEYMRREARYQEAPMWERFTKDAHHVLWLSQQEARELKHGYIGTEHLILGLLGCKTGVAYRVLTSMHILPATVRAKVQRIVGEGEEVAPPEILFTPRAKKIFELALREALSLGHNYIGTEHILLGLIRDGDGVGMRILTDMGLTAETARSEVVAVLAGGRPQQIPERPVFEDRLRWELAKHAEVARFQAAWWTDEHKRAAAALGELRQAA